MEPKVKEVIERLPLKDIIDFEEPGVGESIIIDRFCTPFGEGNFEIFEVSRSLLSRKPNVGEDFRENLIKPEQRKV